MKKKLAAGFAIVALCLSALAQSQNLQLSWSGPAGSNTNGAIFGIRVYSSGISVASDYNTWPITRYVTNSMTTLITNVSTTQWYAITLITTFNGGAWTANGIGPVYGLYSWGP